MGGRKRRGAPPSNAPMTETPPSAGPLPDFPATPGPLVGGTVALTADDTGHLTLRPGDTLIVRIAESTPEGVIDRIARVIRAQLPAAVGVVVVPARELGVIRDDTRHMPAAGALDASCAVCGRSGVPLRFEPRIFGPDRFICRDARSCGHQVHNDGLCPAVNEGDVLDTDSRHTTCETCKRMSAAPEPPPDDEPEWHLSVGLGSPACGAALSGPWKWQTTDYRQVECESCKATDAYRDALANDNYAQVHIGGCKEHHVRYEVKVEANGSGFVITKECPSCEALWALGS